ncbi:MAG: ABC transporter ATP-binding protein [Armatimonadota bacterium]
MPSKPSTYQKRIMAVLEEYRDKEPRVAADRQHVRRLLKEFVFPLRWRIVAVAGFATLMTLQPYLWTFIQRFVADMVVMVGRNPSAEVLLSHVKYVFILLAVNSGIHIINTGFSYANSYQNTMIGQKLVFSLRKALHERLQTLPLSFFDRTQTGRLLTVVLDDVSTIQNSIHSIGINTITSIASIIVGLVLVFSLNWTIGVLVIIAIPGYVMNFRHFRPYLKDANIAARRATTALYSRVEERVAAIRTVKVFGRERPESRSFAESAHNLARLTMYIVRMNNWQSIIANTISALATFGILYIGVREYMQYMAAYDVAYAAAKHLGETAAQQAAAKAAQPHGLSAGQVWQIYRCSLFLFSPAVVLNDISIEIVRVGVILRRVFDLMEADPEPIDQEDAVEMKDARGDISFENVTFTYPGDERPTLRDVSFSIPAGKQVAVMGPSGAGKSTLLYLLMRFYDPEEGGVSLDGNNLQEIQLANLRDRITLVMQEPVIFSGTVSENIRYGRLDASDADVRRAARDADLHNFIQTLPDGYETVVGERGMSLSGGQRQRLALAASLLSRPSVLLLDDTTSALDPATEHRVRETLNRLMQDRTCFVVTHRISTALASDLVIVLEDGQLSQFGTPSDLLTQDGLFRRVYEQQTRESADQAVG